MVGKVIRDYMEGGARKLTVPGFGTFMRKDGGEVIFVDLLRGDDGVLRELVEDYGRYAEVEAMALVDRFVFETRNSIERGGSAVIDGFGTMTLDHKGLYQFNYSPKAKPVKENAVQERLFEAEEPRQAVTREPARTAGASRQPRPASHRPGTKKPAPKKYSRSDIFILVAIIAAVVAIAAMVFAFSAGNMPLLNR